MTKVPRELLTPRLVLRPWRADDAEQLLPLLEANRAHLEPWIPERVAKPVPLPMLAERLDTFAAAFDADREWRYGMFWREDSRVLGELSLFPRDAKSRVSFADADRVEIGYWLRADMTGIGIATEAARAALDASAAHPRFTRAEIRCDARNAPSAAVPKRLGFDLAETEPEPGDTANDPPNELQVWTLSFASDR